MCPNQGSNLFKSAVKALCAAPSPGHLDRVDKEGTRPVVVTFPDS